MDGTEQTLFENTELAEYAGYIFVDSLESGDEIVLRAYIKDVEDGEYKLRDTYTVTYPPPVECIAVAPTIGKVGFKITAQQTAGTYKTLTHMWFKR